MRLRSSVIKRFIKEKTEAGWRFSRPVMTGRSHIRIEVEVDGVVVVWVSPGTPGCHRGGVNAIKWLEREVRRRAGAGGAV